MKTREKIAAILLVLGIILGLGAVGSIEFLGDAIEADELRREIIKSIIAAVLMGASFPVAGKADEEEE